MEALRLKDNLDVLSAQILPISAIAEDVIIAIQLCPKLTKNC